MIVYTVEMLIINLLLLLAAAMIKFYEATLLIEMNYIERMISSSSLSLVSNGSRILRIDAHF